MTANEDIFLDVLTLGVPVQVYKFLANLMLSVSVVFRPGEHLPNAIEYFPTGSMNAATLPFLETEFS